MKNIVLNILSIINIGILKKGNATLPQKTFGVMIPFSGYIVVSRSTFNYLVNITDKKNSAESFPPKEQLPSSSILNWDPDRDHSNILGSAQDYRADISKYQYAGCFSSKYRGRQIVSSGRIYWRLETMRQIRRSMPEVFKGKVLEIGAGTGAVSSTLSQFDEIDEMYCLDYDAYTVENLMPLVQWSLDAHSNKIKRVIGSYNKLECGDNEFDAIVAVGALHHSEDLDATFKECFRVLRPGGVFIVSDYVLTGSLSQGEYSMMMGKPVFEEDAQFVLNGGDIKNVRTNKTISEHARPKYIYQAAAFNAGFNVTTNFFDATTNSGGRLARIYRRARETFRASAFFDDAKAIREFGYDCYGNVRAFSLLDNIRYPAYAHRAPSLIGLALLGDRAGSKVVYDNVVLILEKPMDISRNIPFRFGSGKVYDFPTRPDIV